MSETRWHREEWSCGCKETWNIDRREGGSRRCGKGAACVRDWEVRERGEEIRLDREGIAHFLNEQHQGWHDGMGSLSQTRVYGTALLLADAVRAALAQAEAENERLRAKLAAAETYGEKERGHFEDWFKRACEAEARTRALVEALRMCRRLIDIAETTGNGKYLQQAEAFIDAALTETTPPQEEQG